MKKYQKRILIRVILGGLTIPVVAYMTFAFLLLTWVTPFDNYLDIVAVTPLVDKLLLGAFLWLFVAIYFLFNVLIWLSINESIEIWQSRKEIVEVTDV